MKKSAKIYFSFVFVFEGGVLVRYLRFGFGVSEHGNYFHESSRAEKTIS